METPHSPHPVHLRFPLKPTTRSQGCFGECESAGGRPGCKEGARGTGWTCPQRCPSPPSQLSSATETVRGLRGPFLKAAWPGSCPPAQNPGLTLRDVRKGPSSGACLRQQDPKIGVSHGSSHRAACALGPRGWGLRSALSQGHQSCWPLPDVGKNMASSFTKTRVVKPCFRRSREGVRGGVLIVRRRLTSQCVRIIFRNIPEEAGDAGQRDEVSFRKRAVTEPLRPVPRPRRGGQPWLQVPVVRAGDPRCLCHQRRGPALCTPGAAEATTGPARTAGGAAAGPRQGLAPKSAQRHPHTHTCPSHTALAVPTHLPPRSSWRTHLGSWQLLVTQPNPMDTSGHPGSWVRPPSAGPARAAPWPQSEGIQLPDDPGQAELAQTGLR